MADDASPASERAPDELSGLVALVRLLARQAAREVIASANGLPPSFDPQPCDQRKETLQ